MEYNVVVFNRAKDYLLGNTTDLILLSQRWDMMSVTNEHINNWVEEHMTELWLYTMIRMTKSNPNNFSHC